MRACQRACLPACVVRACVVRGFLRVSCVMRACVRGCLRVSAHRRPSSAGSTVYTCMLNARGGTESDLTVSRLDPGPEASPLAPAFEGERSGAAPRWRPCPWAPEGWGGRPSAERCSVPRVPAGRPGRGEVVAMAGVWRGLLGSSARAVSSFA